MAFHVIPISCSPVTQWWPRLLTHTSVCVLRCVYVHVKGGEGEGRQWLWPSGPDHSGVNTSVAVP